MWEIQDYPSQWSVLLNVNSTMYSLATVANCLRTIYRVILEFSEINIKIKLEWAFKQSATRVHTLCHFIHDIPNPWITIKTTIFTYRPSFLIAQCTFCWWRNIRSWCRKCITRHNNCDTRTRKAKPNSLDINFIYGHICDPSCKKCIYTPFYSVTTGKTGIQIRSWQQRMYRYL